MKNSNTIEREKFTKIIDAHVDFLKKNISNGKTFLRDHRNIALRQVNSYMYDALLQKTLTYSEFRSIRTELTDKLSWEKLTGVKQLSIFEELPNYQ